MIVCSISKTGAALIKWGQWAATRPDMFPEELCGVLSMLHSFAPTHSFKFSKKVIEKATGKPLSEVFDSFSEKPIALSSTK